MTEAQALEAITAAFTTAWTGLRPTVPIAREGESFEAVDTWVRLSVIPADGAQLSMGGKNQRITSDSGFIAVQVFTPIGSGALLRSQLCDGVRTALQLQTLAVAGTDEGVRIFKGASRNPLTDSRWMMQTVVLPFEFYSVA